MEITPFVPADFRVFDVESIDGAVCASPEGEVRWCASSMSDSSS